MQEELTQRWTEGVSRMKGEEVHPHALQASEQLRLPLLEAFQVPFSLSLVPGVHQNRYPGFGIAHLKDPYIREFAPISVSHPYQHHIVFLGKGAELESRAVQLRLRKQKITQEKHKGPSREEASNEAEP